MTDCRIRHRTVIEHWPRTNKEGVIGICGVIGHGCSRGDLLVKADVGELCPSSNDRLRRIQVKDNEVMPLPSPPGTPNANTKLAYFWL